MTRYQYKTPYGHVIEVEGQLDSRIFPQHEFLGEAPEKVRPEPTYDMQRKRHYPPISEQLDALWHAMDDGTLPKIEPFYSQIKEVKEQFPKESN